MASLFKSENYESINTTDTAINGFYVIMFTSEAYTLQENTTIDGQIITSEELVFKAQYICSVEVDINWYRNQHPQQYFTTVPTRTIINPKLEVNAVTDFHAITKSVCNRKQLKNAYKDSLYV